MAAASIRWRGVLDKWFPSRRDGTAEPALREFVTLFRILRALAQERDMLSILVAAYRPAANRHNLLTPEVGENPMYLSFQERFVGFLSEPDTRRMIVDIGLWKDISWDDGALDAVYQACGGHPLLSRFLASEACDRGARKQVTAGDVDRVTAAIRANFRKHRIGTYFEESVWATLRPDEQEALVWAANGDGEPREGWEDALVNLEHFGLIRSEADRHHIEGELLRDWLQSAKGSARAANAGRNI